MNAATSKPQKKSVFDMLNSIKNTEGDSGTLKVPVTDIQPDPDQHRKDFPEEHIKNLAAALAKVGVLQPLLVERTGGLPPYKIVDGERRWRAAPLAGLTELPVYVLEKGENRSLAQAIANANRADLTDRETAMAIKALLDGASDAGSKLKKKEVAELLDLSSSQLSSLLTMLEPEWSYLLDEGLIVKADALSRFRSCPPELQAELIADARATGEPITVLALKRAKSAAAVAVDEPTATVDGQSSEASAATGAPAVDQVNIPNASSEDVAPAADAGGDDERHSDTQESSGADAPFGVAGDAAGEDSAAGGSSDEGAGSTGVPGVGDGDDGDDEADASGQGGHVAPITAAGQQRSKSASLKLTGEQVEALLRYLVDKSTDRLEVKLPGDLAIAVIENLGGEVPDSADGYSERIKDLLEGKLAAT